MKKKSLGCPEYNIHYIYVGHGGRGVDGCRHGTVFAALTKKQVRLALHLQLITSVQMFDSNRGDEK